jgi:hypothetical protein
VLLAKGRTDRLIGIGICYRMEINVNKTKVVKISKDPSPLQMMISHNQQEYVKYFNYLGSMITNDARSTCENEVKIAMATGRFLTCKLVLNLSKKLVKCYIWSIAFYVDQTWTLDKIDQERLKSSEMCCWRRMEKIGWTDRVRNERYYIQLTRAGISYV